VDVEVPIPAGVESGIRLRIRGEGEPGPGGRGDLYCDIVVREHPIFRRRGADLLCEVPIPYTVAALGGSIEVPTLGGETVQMRVPAGTQSGEVLRLGEHGLPRPDGRGRGDLLVDLNIDVPQRLTDRQEELLRELAEIEGAHVSERRKSFLNRIKQYVCNMTHSVDEGEG
jgi:molecular chaperone DnaJ